jgi:hypothetical protein
MPEVPVSELHGGFAFALQGWMRAQKQGSHNYINPGAGTLVTVGLAISTNFTSPEWPQLPEVGELPVATAFYPSQYPQPQLPRIHRTLDTIHFPSLGSCSLRMDGSTV